MVIVVVAAVKKQYYSHNGEIIVMIFLSYKEHQYAKSRKWNVWKAKNLNELPLSHTQTYTQTHSSTRA